MTGYRSLCPAHFLAGAGQILWVGGGGSSGSNDYGIRMMMMIFSVCVKLHALHMAFHERCFIRHRDNSERRPLSLSGPQKSSFADRAHSSLCSLRCREASVLLKRLVDPHQQCWQTHEMILSWGLRWATFLELVQILCLGTGEGFRGSPLWKLGSWPLNRDPALQLFLFLIDSRLFLSWSLPLSGLQL